MLRSYFIAALQHFARAGLLHCRPSLPLAFLPACEHYLTWNATWIAIRRTNSRSAESGMLEKYLALGSTFIPSYAAKYEIVHHSKK